MRQRQTLQLLQQGRLELLGQLANSSNETFLVELTDDDEQCWAIYNPELGEQPLRDFEPGLYRRERAAYLLAVALEWQMIPATVIRGDGPFGPGSLQHFVVHDPGEHVFTLLSAEPAPPHQCPLHDQLRRIALFDLVTNNADRKAGHVLRAEDDHLWAIDHGLCFAAGLTLRTVLWDFAGEAIDPRLLADLATFAEQIPDDVAALLTDREVDALLGRIRQLLDVPQYPEDPTGMSFPWPPI